MRSVKVFLVSVVLLLVCASAYASERVSNIAIKGIERVSKETVFAYLEVTKGEVLDQSKIDESIKSLYKTGFFADVKLDFNAGVLEVLVVENPMINKVAFDGNKRVDDKDILEELSMKPHSIFSLSKMQNDIGRILNIYQSKGRYAAKVEPKLIKLDQNRVNLVYEVEEGPQAVIKKIIFAGNENFAQSELQEIIPSKESRWYRFFSSSDVFDANKQKVDNEFIKHFYQTHGFADFKLTSSISELSPTKDAFLLTYILSEGEIYTYGNVLVENNIKNFNTEELTKLITLKEGELSNIEHIEENIDNLTNYLGNHGFPFVEVEHVLKANPQTRTVEIKFVVKESYKVYLRKINIKNNTRTLDKVVRREFRIAEGDPYNISKIQRSKQRIENLGFFNKVEFKNKRTEQEDKIDIDVDVEETSTGTINLAGGYDTTRGVLASVTLSEENFLGKGQQAQLGITTAQRERGINFAFTEPYFMDRELSAGIEIFATKTNMRKISSFNSKNVGAIFSLGYKLTEYLSHGLRYSIKKERIADVESTASIYVKTQEGSKVVSLVGHTLAYDRLDSIIDPTNGYIVKFSQDLAGLGGNTRYLSNEVTASYFKPVYKKEWIFKLRGKAGYKLGYGGKKVELIDRFYLGPDEVRGFDIAGIGPRDKKTGDALGGNTFYVGTAELYFPLGLPNELGVKGSVFTDFGALWGVQAADPTKIHDKHALRASYGASVHWKSPMGGIAFHYGIPFRKEKFDDIRKFYFSYSTKF
jgi:outer membrane protein insertion porin family